MCHGTYRFHCTGVTVMVKEKVGGGVVGMPMVIGKFTGAEPGRAGCLWPVPAPPGPPPMGGCYPMEGLAKVMLCILRGIVPVFWIVSGT